MSEEPEFRGDRPYTYLVTFLSLAIGVVLAVVIGGTLLLLRQPLTMNPGGGIAWTAGAFMTPLAGLVTVIILGWSVFFLPLTFAKRQQVVLDPEVWPATGAIAVAVLGAIGFLLAILFNII